MEEAIVGVTTVEVTHAVRDSTADGQEIRAGDVIAVVDDRITQVGQDHLAVVEAVLDDVAREPELVTVYRGAGIDEDAAETLVDALRRKHPDVEFEVHDGGQEHYPYILSLE
jgi:dihydroxyacetone kinase-like predicted kinase